MTDAARDYLVAGLACDLDNYMYNITKSNALLKRSAIGNSHALNILLAESGRGDNEVKEIAARIRSMADNVDSLEKFNEFIIVVNEEEAKNKPYFEKHRTSLKNYKLLSWYLVFIISVIGLCLIWYGEFGKTKGESLSSKKK